MSLRQVCSLLPVKKPSVRVQKTVARALGSVGFSTVSSTEALKKTQLYDFHTKELKGKMVDFAGYAMPVSYPSAGHVKSHNHTRTDGCASFFDVSHMGQLKVTGSLRLKFLEALLVGDFSTLESGQGKLSLMTNEDAGIIDDCVVTVYDDHVYIVVNAGNQTTDLIHMKKQLELFNQQYQGDVAIEQMSDRSLVALQGPGAEAILTRFLKDKCPLSLNLSEMDFMNGKYFPLELSPALTSQDNIITRCGYTGEDGFEISLKGEDVAIEFVRQLVLGEENVLEAGLGARDSLRLEAGLCLHGHDICEKTTPIEAALGWTVNKKKSKDAPTYPGQDKLFQQIQQKSITKKRVGFIVEGKPLPVREGAELYDGDEKVGYVTSGTFSPTLKKAIGMAYVNRGFWKVGTKLQAQTPSKPKRQDIVLSKMPFVPAKYFKKEA